MKSKILILCIAVLVLLSACVSAPNCPNGGAYVFTPMDSCVLGFIW